MLSRIPHLRVLINRTTIARTFTHTPVRAFTLYPTLRTAKMAAETDTQAQHTASELSLTPESLTSTLKSSLSASHVDIQDMSGGCGQAFNAIIVSSQFEGKGALARHRLVNNALKKEIAAIHAWTPRCLTPEQWEKEQGN